MDWTPLFDRLGEPGTLAAAGLVIGFVFGFNGPDANGNDMDYWLFDWKQTTQGFGGQTAREGFAVSRVNGTITDSTSPAAPSAPALCSDIGPDLVRTDRKGNAWRQAAVQLDAPLRAAWRARACRSCSAITQPARSPRGRRFGGAALQPGTVVTGDTGRAGCVAAALTRNCTAGSTSSAARKPVAGHKAALAARAISATLRWRLTTMRRLTGSPAALNIARRFDQPGAARSQASRERSRGSSPESLDRLSSPDRSSPGSSTRSAIALPHLRPVDLPGAGARERAG